MIGFYISWLNLVVAVSWSGWAAGGYVVLGEREYFLNMDESGVSAFAI